MAGILAVVINVGPMFPVFTAIDKRHRSALFNRFLGSSVSLLVDRLAGVAVAVVFMGFRIGVPTLGIESARVGSQLGAYQDAKYY